MRVLIIEDERFAKEKLITLLKAIDKDIEIISTLETVEESVNWFQNNQDPDLILMDIELDDGNCFEIFESVKINTPIIFTTAYDEYAIKAFKVNSIDYLLKPIEEELLRAAIIKYKGLHKSISNDKVQFLLNELLKSHKTRFLVKIGNHFKSIPVIDIACFYIHERSTFLRTFVGKNYGIDYSMEQLEKIIDPKLFFRINRNFIVNINSITDFYSYSGSRYLLKLINQEKDDEIIISRNRITDFKVWIDR